MVLAAGAAMNALLPLLIFTVMFMLPQEEEVGRLAVTEVLDGSPGGAGRPAARRHLRRCQRAGHRKPR